MVEDVERLANALIDQGKLSRPMGALFAQVRDTAITVHDKMTQSEYVEGK